MTPTDAALVLRYPDILLWWQDADGHWWGSRGEGFVRVNLE